MTCFMFTAPGARFSFWHEVVYKDAGNKNGKAKILRHILARV